MTPGSTHPAQMHPAFGPLGPGGTFFREKVPAHFFLWDQKVNVFGLWAMRSLLQSLNSAMAAPGAVTDNLCVMGMAVSQSDLIYKAQHGAGFGQRAGVCQRLI